MQPVDVLLEGIALDSFTVAGEADGPAPADGADTYRPEVFHQEALALPWSAQYQNIGDRTLRACIV